MNAQISCSQAHSLPGLTKCSEVAHARVTFTFTCIVVWLHWCLRVSAVSVALRKLVFWQGSTVCCERISHTFHAQLLASLGGVTGNVDCISSDTLSLPQPRTLHKQLHDDGFLRLLLSARYSVRWFRFWRHPTGYLAPGGCCFAVRSLW